MRALFVSLLFFLSGLIGLRAEWTVVQHDGRRHVLIEDVARFYGLNQRAAGSGGFDLSGGGRILQGKAGQKEVKIDGVKYILCFPIVQREGRTLLSAMDATKIIEPVLRPGKISGATQVRTVVLDAGHGGHDSGAVGRLGREKQYALDVADRAKTLLESKGYRVLMTRKSDYFIPLEKRSEFANRQSNAIFVSIHFNKSKTGGGTGIETFALAPRGVPSMGEEDVTVNAVREYPGHARDAENILLATAVHSSLLRYCPLPDRGIKRARFHVIRQTKIPSILVEGGFLDHPLDGRMVASASYRQRMAMAIAEGVMRFQRAVRGRAFVPPPSAVASGADPTSAPSLRPEPSPTPKVGSQTPMDSTMAQIQLEGEATKPASDTQ